MFKAAFAIAILFGNATAGAALLGRAPLTPGGTDYQAYYDDVLAITWLANPGAAAGSAYDDGPSTTDGRLSWAATQAWLDSLNAAGHLGATNWRLPDMNVNGDSTVVDCGGPAICPDNEMGHHSQYNGVQFMAINGQGIFADVGLAFYWTSTPASDPAQVRTFYFPMNEIWPLDKQTGAGAAWAVHSGDVAVVPAPAAVWLLGSALGSALGVARWKRAKAAVPG